MDSCVSFLTVSGQEEFLDVFGDITISDILIILVALGFLISIGRLLRKYIVSRYEANKEKDEQLAEALKAVQLYPELEKQIKELRVECKEAQEENIKHISNMEEKIRKREMNRIRDRLLSIYRYYTNKETNPNGTWTQMEAETFWAQFEDYEEAGGDGHMHTVVQPAMRQLKVVDMFNSHVE